MVMSKLKVFLKKIRIMCKFYNQLKTIVDVDNQEDKKILLLAAMIDSMSSELEAAQKNLVDELTSSLENIRSQVDSLNKEVKGIKQDMGRCPISNTTQKSYVDFILRYPRATLIILIVLGFLAGTQGVSIITKVISLFGL